MMSEVKKNTKEKAALVPRLRFPEFRSQGGWCPEFGNMVFDQISNKDHNSDLPVLAITQEQGAIPRDMIDYHVSVTDKSLESYKVVEIGDFIISLRSFQGGIEFSRYRGICSPAYVILRLRHKHSEDYFRHYLKTDRFIAQITKNLEGLRDGKMISYKQFSELQLPIPPHAEQQKIADCLTSLDDLIAAESHKLDALKTHKKGLMQQLFPREGETVPRLRFAEFREAGEWAECELGSLTTKVGSGITPTGGDKNYKTDGRPFVRSQNIGCGQLILDDVAFIDEETHKSFDSTELKVSDVLLNITGASIGRSAVADSRIAGGNVNQHVCIIRVKHNELIPTLLNQFLISERGQKQIDSFQAGGNRQGLNFAQIRSFEIPLPPTMKEQCRIADCLSSLDDLITAQTQKIETLKTHKKGLMQQLFPVLDEVQA
ncbi:restriction endonuclease subunit S [Desulfovibrionales bacterium]